MTDGNEQDHDHEANTSEHKAEAPEQDIRSDASELLNQQAATESETTALAPSESESDTAKSDTPSSTESATDTTPESDEIEGERAVPPVKLERLQKILAQAGIASRRHAEELITGGRVQVNGQVVNVLGSKADPARDHIRVDGKLLHGAERHRYFVLNKPRGFVTTVSDPEGRPTVMQFFTKMGERLYPVGRLDYLSEGLLLVTNDGDLANRLTKAASGVEKTYLVKVSGVPTEEQLEVLRSGVAIERGKPGEGKVHTAPARVRMVRQGDNPWYEVVLIEGRNRELRKMFEEIGHFVEKIRRVGYGPLVLDLEPGKLRELSLEEVAALRLSAEGKLKRSAKRGPNTKKMLPKDAGKPVRYDEDRPRSQRVPEPGAARPAAARPPRPGFGAPRFDRSGPGFDKSAPRRFDKPASGKFDRPKFDKSSPRNFDKPAGRPFTPRDNRPYAGPDSRTESRGDFKTSSPSRPFRSESPAGQPPRRFDRPRPGQDSAPRRPFIPRPDRSSSARPFDARPPREGAPAREGGRTFGAKPAPGRSFGAKPAWKKPADGKSFGARPTSSRPPFNKPAPPRREAPEPAFDKRPPKLHIEEVGSDSPRPTRSVPPPAFEKPKFDRPKFPKSDPERSSSARPRFDGPRPARSGFDRPRPDRSDSARPKFDRPRSSRPDQTSSDKPRPDRPTSRPTNGRPPRSGGLSRPFTTSSGIPRPGGARPSNKSKPAWKSKSASAGKGKPASKPAFGSKPSFPSKPKSGGFKSRPGGASKSAFSGKPGASKSGSKRSGPRPGGKSSGKPRNKKRG
jgi:23S rRNA pseudouridine2605 synthase